MDFESNVTVTVGMLCKEDIYGWFRDSVSSQRIDLLCGLLQLCLPLELRFVGSCVEEQARKDYCRLVDYELKVSAGPSRATVGPGETLSWGPQNFHGGPSGKKIF